jgi:hypothetical protein
LVAESAEQQVNFQCHAFASARLLVTSSFPAACLLAIFYPRQAAAAKAKNKTLQKLSELTELIEAVARAGIRNPWPRHHYKYSHL